MKHLLLIALALISIKASSQDTLIRSFNATVTFQSFVSTPSGRFSGIISVNDQTNTYLADSVKVNDLVYSSSGSLYVVDTVGTATLFSVPITIRRISGANVAPTGIGDIFRPTKNYGLYTFTPNNQNGISSQGQFIKLTGVINRIDSIAKDISTKTGGTVAPSSQTAGQVAYFSGNDTLAGSNNLFWDNANVRLGIGTTTPSHRFEIKSLVSSTIRLNNTSVGAGSILFASNDTTQWAVGANAGERDWSILNPSDSTYSVFIKKSNSNVGIKNIAPTEALHVKGKVKVDTLPFSSDYLVTANSSNVFGRITPAQLLDSLNKIVNYTYLNSTGNDLSTPMNDSIINLAKVHAYVLRVQSGASSHALCNFNPPGEDDLGKIITITAYDDDSTYDVILSGIRVGSDEPISYTMSSFQSIVLSAKKTPEGNRWVVVANTVATVDLSTYATKTFVNTLLSRDTITSGTLTSGSVTVQYSLFGTGTPTLTSPTAGSYTFTMPANTDFRSIVVTGNTNTLDGALAFTFTVNNSANASDQYFNVQMYSVGTNGLVDQHATGTNNTQTVSSNITTMVFPGMGLFGLSGFRIILR